MTKPNGPCDMPSCYSAESCNKIGYCRQRMIIYNPGEQLVNRWKREWRLGREMGYVVYSAQGKLLNKDKQDKQEIE